MWRTAWLPLLSTCLRDSITSLFSTVIVLNVFTIVVCTGSMYVIVKDNLYLGCSKTLAHNETDLSRRFVNLRLPSSVIDY